METPPAILDVYKRQHPEESYRANVLVPVWIAEAARKSGAGLVAFSSDQVLSLIHI